MIETRKDLVLGFFKNASHMLRTYGEVHPVLCCKRGIGELAMQSFRVLIERADFKKEDHPGYYNKQLTGLGQ